MVMNPRSSRSMRTALPALLLLLSGCPTPPPAPVSLVADPPATDDGNPPGAAETALDRGVAYIKAEAWAEAVPQFDQVIEVDAKNAQAHYYRALALKHLDKKAEAETGLERALSIDPNLIEARMHLGELLLLAEPPKAKKAIDVLAPVVTAEPRAKDVRELLAFAHYSLEQWSEAADHYAVLVELDDQRDVRFQLADALFRAGRHEESVVQMRKLLPLFDKDLKVIVQLAHRFGQAKAFADCVKGLDMAIALDATEAALFTHRGVCKHELGDEKAARNDYNVAIQTNEKFQPAYFYLGKSWLTEKRGNLAVEAFRKCVMLDPESSMGTRAKAELDQLKAQGQN